MKREKEKENQRQRWEKRDLLRRRESEHRILELGRQLSWNVFFSIWAWSCWKLSHQWELSQSNNSASATSVTWSPSTRLLVPLIKLRFLLLFLFHSIGIPFQRLISPTMAPLDFFSSSFCRFPLPILESLISSSNCLQKVRTWLELAMRIRSGWNGLFWLPDHHVTGFANTFFSLSWRKMVFFVGLTTSASFDVLRI